MFKQNQMCLGNLNLRGCACLFNFSQGNTKLVMVNEVEQLKWKTDRNPSNVIEGLCLFLMATIGQTKVLT